MITCAASSEKGRNLLKKRKGRQEGKKTEMSRIKKERKKGKKENLF